MTSSLAVIFPRGTLRQLSSQSDRTKDCDAPVLLKCHYDQILDTHFLHFRTQQVFPRYLAKFQSITNIRTRGFWTFISENLRPPLISLVPSLGEN